MKELLINVIRVLKRQYPFCYEWNMASFERGGSFGVTPKERQEFVIGGRERERSVDGGNDIEDGITDM